MNQEKLINFANEMNKRRNVGGAYVNMSPHHAKEKLKIVAKKVAEENAKHMNKHMKGKDDKKK